MIKAVRLIISGSVQGIYFRQFVKDSAEQHKVRGFVRNLGDGKVEAFLEGDQDAVQAVVSLCKQGPKHAQIRNVEEKDEKFQDFKEFKILKF